MPVSVGFKIALGEALIAANTQSLPRERSECFGYDFINAPRIEKAQEL